MKIKTSISDIAGGIVCLAISSVYVLSLTGTVKKNYDIETYKHIWLLTLFSVVYAISFIVYTVAKGFWFKVGSAIMLGIFAVNLGVEIWANGENWNIYSRVLLVLVPIKLFLVVVLVEKIKSRKDARSRS
jgi:hypothetical protein